MSFFIGTAQASWNNLGHEDSCLVAPAPDNAARGHDHADRALSSRHHRSLMSTLDTSGRVLTGWNPEEPEGWSAPIAWRTQ